MATGSERQIFDIIRDAPNTESYSCFHSLGIARHERKEYAESDFVLLGPRGMFCIEVKGGVVKRENGIWKIGSGVRSYTSTEGPFAQSQSARWALKTWLEATCGLPVWKDMLVGWGVAFPNIIFDERDPSWDVDVIYDLRDTEVPFLAYLNRLENYFTDRKRLTGKRVPLPMSSNRVKEYSAALRPDFDVGLTLRGLMIESRREIESLSTDQYRVLDYTLDEHNPRLLCAGGPGTGKTIVALEASRRLSKRGLQVLHLCYNRALADVLDRQMQAEGAKFRVETPHGFLGRIITQAGMRGELSGISEADSPNTLYETGYPRVFEDACTELLEEGVLPQYDVLVIDEAQDVLTKDFLTCLGLVLGGGIENGRWTLFLDPDMQSNVYNRFDAELVETMQGYNSISTTLFENFRNPERVVREAYALVRKTPPHCRRKIDSRVEFKPVTGERDAGRKLRALLVELIRDGIQPVDIALLSFRKKGDRLFDRYPPDVGKPLVPAVEAGQAQDAFVAATVSGYKGLESEIVILTDLPDNFEDAWTISLLLVALTRTRTKAFVLASDRFLLERTKRLTMA